MDATRDSPNPGAPSFADIGRRVTDDRALATRLKAVTRQGHYAMPPRSLSASDRRAVVAFIRSTADHAWRD